MLHPRLDPAAATLDRAVLQAFRSRFYGCATRRADALFELTDATIGGLGRTGLPPPHLSLEAVFRRGHGSAYAALSKGRLDAEAVRDCLVHFRPRAWPRVFAVDTSSWPRCDAETSPERGFYHHPSRHSNGQPIVAGWNYSWIAQLNWERNSWTAPIDTLRIPPRADTGPATAQQLTALVRRLPGTADEPAPLFVLDAGYDPIALTVDCATAAQLLVRIREDRVFYADPPARLPGTVGRPRRHGAPFRCANPSTWPGPDATRVTADPQYGRVEVSAWPGLHPRLRHRKRWAEPGRTPIVTGTVIRVEVEHLPRPTARVKKTLWLWWAGPPGTQPDLDCCWRAYIRRFDVEHMLRFVKTTLGWVTPRVRTPEQADRWTWLVVAGYTELRLARGLVADHRLPWEPPRDPDRLTPTRVRRGFGHLLPMIGTPARPPKPSKAGPGRPKGSRRGPAARCPAIKKAA